MKFILVYALASIWLAGCGKACTHTLERPRAVKFGPLEKVECPAGEILFSATPVYEPGGKVNYVEAVCGLSTVRCE